MAKIIGKAKIFVDGNRLEMENGAEANPGGIKREFERHCGRTYDREEEVPPEISGNVLHTRDTDVVALSNIEGATVIFEADTGQRYVMSGAKTADPVPIDSKTGKSPLKLVGDSFDRM